MTPNYLAVLVMYKQSKLPERVTTTLCTKNRAISIVAGQSVDRLHGCERQNASFVRQLLVLLLVGATYLGVGTGIMRS
jgi:hypothetical protein